MQKSTVRKVEVDHSGPAPGKFGDIITCDWSVLKPDTKSRAGHVDQLTILDRGTRWVYSHATDTREHEEIIIGFSHFLIWIQNASQIYAQISCPGNTQILP